MLVNRGAGEPTDSFAIDVLPDTAILKNRKPFFVPDFADNWEYRVAIAYRVSRLGKNIATKFASRYYDAATIALVAVPVDFDNLTKHSAMATAFDDAVAIGDWVPIEETASLQISVGGKAITLSAEDVAIDKVVAHLSRYFTFKIGDIVVPLVTDVTLPIALDRTITGEMKNTEVLNLKIK